MSANETMYTEVVLFSNWNSCFRLTMKRRKNGFPLNLLKFVGKSVKTFGEKIITKRLEALDLTVTSVAHLAVTRRVLKVITEQNIVMIISATSAKNILKTIQDVEALVIAR